MDYYYQDAIDDDNNDGDDDGTCTAAGERRSFETPTQCEPGSKHCQVVSFSNIRQYNDRSL